MTAAGAVVWTVIALGAPPPQQPAASQTPPPTGLIVGRAVDAASGRPIAGAIVSLNGAGVPTAGGPPTASRQPRAMTNASGQFVFRHPPKARIPLTASRPGYVQGAYGRRHPNGTPAQLKLDDAQRVSDVVIPMWRQATVTGVVTDESGEPLIGVQVQLLQRVVVGGRRRLITGPTATTDDRGVYRAAALSPGDYLVAFVWRQTSVPMAIADLPRTAGGNDPKTQEVMRERVNLGAGGIVGGTGSPWAIQIGGSLANLPFGFATPPPVAEEKGMFIYPTQFYPGVPSAARAAVITLTSGQDREGVDFSLRPIRTFRVSGMLIGPTDRCPTRLCVCPSADEALTELETSATMSAPAAASRCLACRPGRHDQGRSGSAATHPTQNTTTMMQIQVGSSMVMTSSSGPPNPAAPPPISDEPTMFAELPVGVGNADVSDLLVTLQRGARMTGRLEFDGTRDRPDATALTRVLITLDRVDALATPGVFVGNVPQPGRADETGAFKTYGVAAGRYVVRVGGAPTGWTLRSVTLEGRDVSDSPIDLRTTDANNVVVTFTDRPTKLTGVARSANGSADADAVVVIFPADSSASSDYLSPRRIRGVHASRDGTYVFDGLPPGDYVVTAIHEDTTPEWRDARVLEDLSRGGTQVKLVEGDARSRTSRR
jgi:hypothetical protein